MSRPRSRALLALPLVAVLGLAACSGDSAAGGRPSAEELSAVFSEGESSMLEGLTMEQEMADCWGGVLHDSDVSDETLRALVNDDDSVALDEESPDTEALATALTDGLEECGTPE